MRNFTLNVGTKRISQNLDPTQATYTRDVRAQMQDVQRNFNEVLKAIAGATVEIVEEVLDPTFKKSLVYVPKRTGRLMGSGYLIVREASDGIHGEIGYGKGGDPPYAVYVHEMVQIPHRSPTRAKFLQSAVEEDMGEFQGRIFAAYLRRM